MSEPRTEAGRALAKVLAEADIHWPDELTRIAPAVFEQLVVRVEDAVLADLRAKVQDLPTWDKRSVPGGLHINRAAVLALIDEEQS